MKDYNINVNDEVLESTPWTKEVVFKTYCNDNIIIPKV